MCGKWALQRPFNDHDDLFPTSSSQSIRYQTVVQTWLIVSTHCHHYNLADIQGAALARLCATRTGLVTLWHFSVFLTRVLFLVTATETPVTSRNVSFLRFGANRYKISKTGGVDSESFNQFYAHSERGFLILVHGLYDVGLKHHTPYT